MDVIGTASVILVTKTHESLTPLPKILAYQWFYVDWDDIRLSGGVRGSGGVACLVRDRLVS